MMKILKINLTNKRALKLGQKALSILLVFALLVSSYLSLFVSVAQAASSPWSQTDWSTGDYSSTSGVKTSVSGELTIDATSNWYNSSWGFRRKITFDNDAAGSEVLTNFVTMVKLDSTRVDYSNTQNSGQDIRFTDSDGTTLLSYEIEKWDESGTSTVWVKVPQIDLSATDYIYMYYGNTGATDAQDADSVWGTQTRYHLAETTTSDANQFKGSGYYDTGKLSQGVTMYGNAAGTAGSKLVFNAGSQISGSNYERLNTNQFTISFWVKPSWAGNDNQEHYMFDALVAGGRHMVIRKDSSNRLQVEYLNSLYAPYSGLVHNIDISSWTSSTWYNVVAIVDADNSVDGTYYSRVYINNIAQNNGNTTARAVLEPQGLITIGQKHDGTSPANALLDDFAVFDRVLTTTEISNIYNSGTGRSAGYVSDPSLKFYANLDGSGTLSPVTYNLGANVDNTSYNATTNTNGNLATDGDMESADLANWSDYVSPVTKEKVTDSNTLFDTKSLHVVTDAGASYEGTYKVWKLGAEVGEDYHISAWVKTAGSNKITVAVGSGAFQKYLNPTGPLPGDAYPTWTKLETEFEVQTAGTQQIYFTQPSGTPTEFYVDNVVITPSQITNGSMGGTYDTEGTGILVAPGWNSTGMDEGTDTASKDAAIFHTNTDSQKIVVDAASEGIASTAFNITSGQSYLVTGWVYVTSGTAYMRDDNGTLGTKTTVTTTTGSWERLSFVGRATTTTTQAIEFRSYISAATFYVDDVSVIPLDNVAGSFQAWTPVNDATGNNPLSVHADSDGVTSNTSGQVANAYTFDGNTGFLRQKTYDLNVGTLSYADSNTDISDTGQEFEDWDNDDGGSAEYMIVVTNSDNTTSWGYFCANDSGTQTAVYTKKACTGGAEGFNGTSPSGKTPVGYEVRKTDFQITGNISIGAWISSSSVISTQAIITKSNAVNGYTLRPYELWIDASSLKASVGTSNAALLTGTTVSNSTWYLVTATYDGTNLRLYRNGQIDTSPVARSGSLVDRFEPLMIGNEYSSSGYRFNGSIDEPFIASSALTAGQILAQYESESDTFNTYASEEQYFGTSNTLTSSIFDSGQSSDWGTLTYTATTPTNTTASVKIRTSNSSSMAGATDFSSCSAILSNADISSNSCVTDSHRYAQYLVTLTTTDPFTSPTFSEISLTFSQSAVTLTLDSPGDNTYTNSERPTFRFRAGSDAATLVSSYTLEVDNGDSGDFNIESIPSNRTTDYDVPKYHVTYDGFSDSDQTNNYISVYTKSTNEWGDAQNDGKLKEGKRRWNVKAVDTTGVQYANARDLNVDRTAPSVVLTSINTITSQTGSFATTDTTPTIKGAISDPTSASVSSGPSSVEIKIEKRSGLVYSPVIVYTQQDAASAFEYTTQELSSGAYRLTLTAQDKAGNSSSGVTYTLQIGSFSEVTVVEEPSVTFVPQPGPLPSIVPQAPTASASPEPEITVPTKEAGPSIFETVGEKIGQGFLGVVGATGNLISFILKGIGQGVSASVNIIALGARGIGNAIVIVAKGAGSAIAFVARNVGSGLAFIAQGSANILATIGNAIGNAYNSLALAAPEVIGNVMVSISNAFTSTTRSISALAINIGNNIGSTGNSLAQGIGSGVTSIYLAITSGASNIASGVKNTFANIAFWMGEKTQDISDRAGLAIIKFTYNFVSEPTRIYDVKTEVISATSARISWQTNHPANGKVNYGLDETYSKDIQTDKRTTHHEFVLENLTPDTQYFFEVMSQNKNYVYDANRKFKTLKE